MSGYLRNMGDNIRMLQRGLADVEDVARYARIGAGRARRGRTRRRSCRASARRGFENVTFRYKSAEKPLYRDFDLTIRPGERIALVGPTGSGKSTFVKLLQRLYDVQGGRILIDGQDIAKVRQGDLRRAIAVVPQDPALFHRSIAENIGYARPDATAEEIALAAKRARAHDFIAALRQGLRHPGRRARREALGRRAPAGGDRPRVPGRRADPGAGRGDLVARTWRPRCRCRRRPRS